MHTSSSYGSEAKYTQYGKSFHFDEAKYAKQQQQQEKKNKYSDYEYGEDQYGEDQYGEDQYGDHQYGDQQEETQYANTKNSYSKKYKKPTGPSFISTVYNGIKNRAYNVIDIIPCALETIFTVGAITVGLVATPAAAIFSRNKRLDALKDLTNSSNLILSNIFETFILILNPNLNDDSSRLEENQFKKEKSLVGLLSKKISKTAEGFAKSDNFLSKHLICRIIHCLAIPATLIAGIVDLAIATILATLTVVTLGKVEGLYKFAHLELRGTSAIALAANHFYHVITPRNE